MAAHRQRWATAQNPRTLRSAWRSAVALVLLTGGCSDSQNAPPTVLGSGGDSPAGCGDGVVATGEACDDGNTTSCDGCNASCTEIEDEATWYPDEDGDGYGSAAGATHAYCAPAGAVADDSDCDDSDASVHLGAEGQCETDPACGDGVCAPAERCSDCPSDCGLCCDGGPCAFPGAEGFGAATPGGRGGAIVRVTSLADSGPGTLREALYETTGPRIVVFDVGGVIELASTIVIREPYVTVAGQTAPAPGVTLADYGLRIYGHDVVVQHLFVRANPTFDTGGGDGIAIKVDGGDHPHDIVIDHCSVSWANDENVSVFAGYGNLTDQHITISNCLIGEGHYGFLLGQSSTRVSALRNVVMSAVERHPRVAGGTYVNIVNNLLYNADGSSFTVVGDGTEGADRVSVVGNLYLDGPSTGASSYGVAVLGTAAAGTQVYAPDTGPHANAATNAVTRPSDTAFLVDALPVPLDGITILPAEQVELHVLAHAGARPAERQGPLADPVDLRFIQEITSRTGSVKDREVQPWTRPESTTRDFAPFLPADPHGDDDGDGYTNIEEVLAELAREVEGR